MPFNPEIANPRLIDGPDVQAAVYAFVLAFALPALEPDGVIHGWQNRAALPSDGNEYAVITLRRHQRHGTNVEEFVADGDADADGVLTVKTLISCSARIDLCSDSDLARQRAQALETMARSSTGVNFFRSYGLSCLGAGNVREHCFHDEAEQFVHRYSTDLFLEYWSGLRMDMPWFDAVTVSRLENVDAHHPPEGAK